MRKDVMCHGLLQEHTERLTAPRANKKAMLKTERRVRAKLSALEVMFNERALLNQTSINTNIKYASL